MTDRHDTDTRDVETRDIETRDTEARDVEARDAATREDVDAYDERTGLSFFDPDAKFVDRTNFLGRMYDAPDEEWFRWQMSVDGRTRHRI